MTPTAITLNQTRLMLDPRGALYWPDRDLLAVADLHTTLSLRGLDRPHTVHTVELQQMRGCRRIALDFVYVHDFQRAVTPNAVRLAQ